MYERGRRIWELVHVQGHTRAAAYRLAYPDGTATDKNATTIATRWEDYFLAQCPTEHNQLMQEMGLGVDRLLLEVLKRLNATKVLIHMGKITYEYDGRRRKENRVPVLVQDNGTRMAATSLLADLHGMRKSQLEVSGTINVLGEDAVTEDEKAHARAQVASLNGHGNTDD